jgi:hypothetical protein
MTGTGSGRSCLRDRFNMATKRLGLDDGGRAPLDCVAVSGGLRRARCVEVGGTRLGCGQG